MHPQRARTLDEQAGAQAGLVLLPTSLSPNPNPNPSPDPDPNPNPNPNPNPWTVVQRFPRDAALLTAIRNFQMACQQATQ